MDGHFTTLRLHTVDTAGDTVVAWCPEHRQIGDPQRPTQRGFNALVTEARAHDHQVHDVYRTVKGYRRALATEAAEFRAAMERDR